jgi:hypothetical protein
MANPPSSLRPSGTRTARPIFRLVDDFDKSHSDGVQNKSALAQNGLSEDFEI